MKYFLILICLCLGMISCKNKSEVGTDAQKAAYDPMGYYQPIDKKTKFVATSQGVLNGKIILNSKVPFLTSMEYDSAKVLLNSKLLSGGTKLITHFNETGKEIKSQSFMEDKLNVFQENKYNERGDLLEEFRLDRNESKYDTSVYRYLYKYKRNSKDYTMIRTNNGDTVTHYKVKYKGTKEYKSEKAHPNKYFYLLRNYETTFNEDKKPIEILQTLIYKDTGSETYDTTESKSIYEYNQEGLLISEKNINHGLKPAAVLFKYKNGLIKEKIVGRQIIKFSHLEIQNN